MNNRRKRVYIERDKQELTELSIHMYILMMS